MGCAEEVERDNEMSMVGEGMGEGMIEMSMVEERVHEAEQLLLETLEVRYLFGGIVSTVCTASMVRTVSAVGVVGVVRAAVHIVRVVRCVRCASSIGA